jgi:predicted dehydrogenase
MRHTLVFLEPGHFHAALTLRARNPDVRDEIVVYASAGAELDDFLALVASFNARRERPTGWRPVAHVSANPLERLLAERPGDPVILAGRNDRKSSVMRRLHDAGHPVLADKPWLAGPDGLGDVEHVLAGGPPAIEIMTGRHELTSILTERLVHDPDVFGAFREDGEAAISLGSVHYLAKLVNGVPLRRPPWFFDVRVQGDGIADIPTHMVDQVQRLTTRPPAGPSDVTLLSARRWATRVPRDVFARITEAPDFPAELEPMVDDGALAYFGNCEMRFRVGAVIAGLSARWDLAVPPGGGDTHEALFRGTKALIRVEQTARSGFRRRLVVEPGDDAAAAALGRAATRWQADLPGLHALPVAEGFELQIPDALRTGHEEHFPLVLRDFLDHVERGSAPAALAASTLVKYRLLTQAGTLARAASA